MDYEKEYKSLVAKVKKAHLFAQTDSTKKVLEDILPQLRESEDERIAEELIKALRGMSTGLQYALFLTEEKKQRWLAWLEKKKINTEGDFGRGYDCGYQAGYAVAMNEMKPKVATATLDLEKQKEQEHICDSAQYEEGFKTGLEIGLRKQKEQKPAEWSEEDEKAINDACCFIEEYAGYIKGIDGKRSSMLFRIADKLKSLRPQPKQEWSKEDEHNLNSVISLVHSTSDGAWGSCIGDRIENWLKSLRPRKLDASKLENFDPAEVLDRIKREWPMAWEKVVGKQEWSEEDEKYLDYIIKYITHYDFNQDEMGTLEEYHNLHNGAVNFLKSLRPQPREEIYHAAKHDLAIRFMNYLDENRPEGKMGLSNGECEDIDKAFKENDWAKIMRYVEKYSPSWKPSEEQMKALNKARRFIPYNCDILESLYEHLKKLSDA